MVNKIKLDEIYEWDCVGFMYGAGGKKYKIVKHAMGYIPIQVSDDGKNRKDHMYNKTIQATLSRYRSGIVEAKWFANEQLREDWLNGKDNT